MTEGIRDALFSVIRAAMGEGTPPPAPDADTCAELLRVAARQSILPIVYDGLRRIGAPEHALSHYEKARLRDGYYTIQREDALARIRAALDSAEVPYVLLKGAVLRLLYPDPDWRTSCDIDVLVERARLDEAIGAIESETDFFTKERNYHDISMVSDLIHLELHFSIQEDMENIDRLLTAAWEYARPTGEGACHAFTPEYQLFHVVAHMCYHMVHGGLGIRPFLDLWLLWEKTEFDEENLRAMCETCGLLTFYEKCLALCESWFGGQPLAADLADFETYCLEGGVFGHEENAGASRLRERSKAGYVLRRLFSRKAMLEEEYPGLKGRPFLLPWYTVKRWTRLFNREKRDAAFKDVRGVNAATPEKVSAFDRLLTDLGL